MKKKCTRYNKVKSTEEFGPLSSIKIIVGDIDKGLESTYYKDNIDLARFEYDQQISLSNIPEKGYLRVEVKTEEKEQAKQSPEPVEGENKPEDMNRGTNAEASA